jgi:hypothetical protein
MPKAGLQTANSALAACPGNRTLQAAEGANDALKYSKEKVYQGGPTSGLERARANPGNGQWNHMPDRLRRAGMESRKPE